MAAIDDVIRERLIFLRNEVTYLKRERDNISSLQEYQENIRLKKAVERSLQVGVEICLDIGRRIIALRGFEYPQTNRDVFEILRQEDVLPDSLLPALRKMAGFRNIAVHDYVHMDDAQVYGILKTNLSDFEAYASVIYRYLTSDREQET